MIKNTFFKLQSNRWLPVVLAALAVLVYMGQALGYAHTEDVTMDEGTYLMKGLLYVQGDYQPFQEYGPLTNKMPLAFYIPGAAQAIFGPGLRTGRYFSIFLAVVMLIGLWLAARRLSGRWMAAGLLWVVAVSPAVIMQYTLAISQVIVACLLTWSLALVLGEKRKLWELALGALLAAMTVLTRQNMLPVMFFVLLYIFWQHGRKAGGVALLVSGVVLLAVHVHYWPGIFQIWRPWIPKAIKVLLPFGRYSLGATSSTWNPEFNWPSRIFVFMEGLRFNFFALWGALTTWLLWPRRKEWQSGAHFRASVFLSVTLLVLVGAHYWAAAFRDYCLYCYTGYLAFFSPVALLLVAASFSSWMRWPGMVRQILAVAAVAAGAAGVAYGAWQELAEPVLNIPIPRVTNMRIQPGMTELWRSLSNKFGLSYDTLQQLLPTIAGLLFGLALLAVVGAIMLASARRSRKAERKRAALRNKRTAVEFDGGSVQESRKGRPYGWVVLVVFFTLGTVFTPSPVFAGGSLDSLCGPDVIASHEAVGKQLAQQVPPGSLVFWENDVSPLPLLYIPGVRVFPAQLNHWYTYLEGGNPAQLERYGYWNAELSRRWLTEADYALVSDKYVLRLGKQGLSPERYDEIESTPLTVPCRGRSNIHIFRRIP